MRARLVKIYVEHYNHARLNSAVEADVYRGSGFPSADQLCTMFQVSSDFEKEVLAAGPPQGS